MSEKKRVLMVDDEARFRETTSRLLTKKGFETTIAASGEEALRILQKSPQDVVILDVRMEGMDGHATLSEIKKMAPETQVIMLTGHGSPDSALSSRQREAFDYLTKPCDIDLLTLKINEAIAAKRQSPGAQEKRAKDIMLGIDDYTTVSVDTTIREAIGKLMKSFQPTFSGSRIMDSGHRSLLIFNHEQKLVGILSTLDLIRGVRPAYLSSQRPDMSASIQFSTLFWGGWDGLFAIQMEVLAEKTVRELMSDPPPTISGDTNLIQVADLMFKTRKRRLIVTEGDKVIGIVRERDLFFEMARIVLHEPDMSGSKPSS